VGGQSRRTASQTDIQDRWKCEWFWRRYRSRPRHELRERHTEQAEIKKARIFSVLEGSTVTWRLSENDVAREGIPNPFRAALIVETDGKFSIRVKYQANLSRSVDPRSWRSPHATLTQPLDLSQIAVRQGSGPVVAGIEEMEKGSFDLAEFALTEWDL
jgi:hypothetical protein